MKEMERSTSRRIGAVTCILAVILGGFSVIAATHSESQTWIGAMVGLIVVALVMIGVAAAKTTRKR